MASAPPATSLPSPPLLLTKRLTALFRSNLTPYLHTTLLATPSGKLLAHASSYPVSVLRSHAAAAASLSAIHSSSALVPTALPTATSSPEVPSLPSPPAAPCADGNTVGRRLAVGLSRPLSPTSSGGGSDGPAGVAITVQMSDGAVVVRRLRCGLLLVCVGSGAVGGAATGKSAWAGLASSSTASAGVVLPGAIHGPNLLARDIKTPPPPLLPQLPRISSSSRTLRPGGASSAVASSGPPSPSQLGASPSDGGSILSGMGHAAASYDSGTSTGSASAAATRRHVDELVKWLDDRLGTLRVPEEGMDVVC